MTGRAVNGFAAVAQCKVIGNRDRFIVGYEEAVLRAGGRHPTAHPGACAGREEIYGGATSEGVLASDGRQMLFMRSPAELGGLKALRDEAIHRPCIPKCIDRFWLPGPLGIALGDVNALNSKGLHQPPPAFAGTGDIGLPASVPGDVEQGLLDKPRDHRSEEHTSELQSQS